MLSSINPYGVGSVYKPQNTQGIAQTESQKPQATTQSIETQELPQISQNALEIRKFSDGVKGANEMIGAMQIADITLNALSNQRQNSSDLSALDNTAKAAQFKGEGLFGRELSLSLAGESVSLSLPLPSQISGDLGESLANKHEEILDKMGQISGLIEKASLPFTAPNGASFDFENFDPSSLKGIFG
ncbi:MAG: flagellar FLiS export co-chaperone [Helicobacteraceae bacterium]|nr:flagellar FLiS export co-chaperone [Helicobacteraceae bacterium]